MLSVPCRARVMNATEVQTCPGTHQLPGQCSGREAAAKQAPGWTELPGQELAFTAKRLLQDPPSGGRHGSPSRRLCFVYFKVAGVIK